ncbi:hypothetical protein H9L12_06425 [Sphingomonas rhizophila]|uniref:Uncharacterized protein n=1 Tax=Sphingomonas rhizophila TaxID=2071607 RepID=A0A7G9SE26_9SPHN|nr:hypothetical protein [Sphingomonas rhizophila]QNN66101.1 hypothetical protein H9L12_06425 [Sphingomonas rhizophila]
MTEGEKLHAEQRRKFWRNLMIVGAFGAPLGFGVGFGFGKSRGDFDAFWTMVPQWLVVALVALSVGGLLYGSWRFYRSIDEIELVDNLWSSVAAYAAYAVIFPAWWALGKAKVTPEPNDWAIYLAALVIGLAAYGKRKWDAR